MDSIVSVIVPIYNVERYIHKCVDSIMNQTYKNLEIILVNDGSPDQSPEICNQYSLHDKRIRVVHKKNGGLSDARNTGLEVCTGEYILFVDGDDYVESTLVENAVKVIEEKKSDVVIWGYHADYVDSGENLVSTTEYKGIRGNYDKHNFSEIPLSNQLIGLLGYAWNKLYKSDLISRHNHTFIKGLSLVEDIVFNGPLLEQCDSITFIEDSLVHYVQRPRETLGAKFYSNYFDLKKMAMNSVNNLLISWGKSKDEVELVVNQMGFNALKSTTRVLSQASNYVHKERKIYLQSLLEDKVVKKILKKASLRSLKDKLIRQCMIREKTLFLLMVYKKR